MLRNLFIGCFFIECTVFNDECLLRRKIKYPKLSLFIISVILVYFLFSGLAYKPLHDALVFMGYFGTFLAGLLYPYALTSAAGTGILLILAKEQNLLLAGVIAGIGALISDIILFLFVKHGFGDEVQKLSKETVVRTIIRRIPDSVRVYLLAIFAGLLIASPLPTEIGIMLMTSIKNMSVKKFVIIVYILHASAIFIILLIGNTI
jgi:uncharacterized membrane protein YdjX (TVP38/TMEM64 family)